MQDNFLFGSYRNNLREGVWEHFYENGNLESIMNFVNDKFEGVHEQYKIDGSMERQVSFKDGVAISGKKYDNYGIPRDMTRAELYNEYNKK